MVEKNTRTSTSIPVKTIRIFPSLRVGETSLEHVAGSSQGNTQKNISYKLALVKGIKGDVKRQINNLIKIILFVPDLEVLCDRLKQTVDLHLNNLHKIKVANDSNKLQ